MNPKREQNSQPVLDLLLRPALPPVSPLLLQEQPLEQHQSLGSQHLCCLFYSICHHRHPNTILRLSIEKKANS